MKETLIHTYYIILSEEMILDGAISLILTTCMLLLKQKIAMIGSKSMNT